VCRQRFGAPVDLDEDEARGILAILDHVEARDARLLRAFFRVRQGRLLERLDVLGTNATINVNDEQCSSHG